MKDGRLQTSPGQLTMAGSAEPGDRRPDPIYELVVIVIYLIYIYIIYSY